MFTSLKLCASAMGTKIRSFFSKENGEVNIVAIVVLCGIAVILAIVFKKEIDKLIKTLFGTIQDKATDAVSDIG